MSLLIIGQSFVYRLHTKGVELSESMSPTFSDVSVEGIRGGNVEHLRGKLSAAERTRPSVVLIDVGTNELSSPSVNPSLRDRRVSPSVQTAPAGGDSCHHADSTARGGQLSLSYKTWLQWCASCRQQSRSGHLLQLPWSVHVEAEVLPSTPGEVHWSKDGVHPNFLSLRKYMNEVRTASLFGTRQSATTINAAITGCGRANPTPIKRPTCGPASPSQWSQVLLLYLLYFLIHCIA